MCVCVCVCVGGGGGADNSVKVWQKLPINNLKADVYDINAQTKFGENWYISK